MGTNLLVTFSMANWNTLSNWTLGTKAIFYCSHNFKQPGKMFPILLLLEINVCHVQQSAMSLFRLTLNETFACTFIGQMCKTRSLQIVHMSIGSGLTEILNCIWVKIFCCEEARSICAFFLFFWRENPKYLHQFGGGWAKFRVERFEEMDTHRIFHRLAPALHGRWTKTQVFILSIVRYLVSFGRAKVCSHLEFSPHMQKEEELLQSGAAELDKSSLHSEPASVFNKLSWRSDQMTRFRVT